MIRFSASENKPLFRALTGLSGQEMAKSEQENGQFLALASSQQIHPSRPTKNVLVRTDPKMRVCTSLATSIRLPGPTFVGREQIAVIWGLSNFKFQICNPLTGASRPGFNGSTET